MSFTSWPGQVAGVDPHVILRGRGKPHAAMEMTIDNTDGAVWAASPLVGFLTVPTSTPVSGTVDWDDGHGPVPLVEGMNVCATYMNESRRGVFHVKVNGTFGRFGLADYIQSAVMSIDRWDPSTQTTALGSSSGSPQLTIGRQQGLPPLKHVASPPPTVTSLRGAFMGVLAGAIAPDAIAGWDTSHVTDMQGLFQGTKLTEVNIANWNTSAVTNMQQAFAYASNLEVNPSRWDTSHVTTMREAFNQAAEFNADLSGWNVSLVTDMYAMFGQLPLFNSDLSDWDTRSCTNMDAMFVNKGPGTSPFDSDLSGWPVPLIASLPSGFDAYYSSPEHWRGNPARQPQWGTWGKWPHP